ncbi:MAG: pyridoxal phosphate-dependent aminotransferase, partial [Dongiaceae bacterium]
MLNPRPGIMDIAPYRGGESRLDGHAKVIKLASNENPLGPSPRAIAAYRELAAELHRYPDGGADALRQAIADHHGLEAAQIVCGAGSDELITLLVRGYAGPGDEVLYSQYGFLMYALAAKTVGAVPVGAPEPELRTDVDALLGLITPRTRLLFLANPNNPTGCLLPSAEVLRLHAGLPKDVLLVLDSAYAEYVGGEDYQDGARLVRASDNVVMLRTFSKIHCLAALRIGWAYGPPAVADVLNRVRNPFNVNAPAQAAALAALTDRDHAAAGRAH